MHFWLNFSPKSKFFANVGIFSTILRVRKCQEDALNYVSFLVKLESSLFSSFLRMCTKYTFVSLNHRICIMQNKIWVNFYVLMTPALT